MQASSNTARLTEMGATIFIGHRAENLGANLEVVIVSSAIPPNNPELLAAQQRGLTIVKRDKWLGQMMQNQVGIGIAGTHGKTTTTGLTAFLLQEAGQNPTYIVGGFVPQLDTNAAAGQGDVFVIEADEYDHMFLGLRPDVAVITVVEWDHPDIFPTLQALNDAYIDFVRLIPAEGLVIGCGDAPGVQDIIQHAAAKVVTYGLEEDNDWQAINLRPNQRGGYDFEVLPPQVAGQAAVNVSLAIPGVHNAYNALAVLIIAWRQGLDLPQAAKIMSRFKGVERRFQIKGEVNDIIIIDDYAHHPTEIKATLAAARTRFEGYAIWVSAQPHTFSRVLTLFDEFVTAFDAADHVIINDIYASRETDEGIVSSRDIVDRMLHPDVRYIGSLNEATAYLATHITSPAVLLTLGAGDGYLVGEGVLDRLRDVC
jgi:UDP-N-acetylmuramate--alanine ligase